MRKIALKNIVWKEGEYYVAESLNTHVSSFGKTKREALNNLKEALDLYFEDEKEPTIVKIEKPEIIQSSFSNA